MIGERIAAGTHTARPFDPALSENHGLCAGQPGCTESNADDSIRISFTVPDGWALAEEVADIAKCPFGYLPWAPAFYAQSPNHRWHVWSLDVDGIRVVIQSGDFPGTLPQDLAEMHAIIESIQIEP